MSSTKSGGAPPLTFLAISQNIGSIDCSHIKSTIPDDVKTMTQTFLASLRIFIQEAAKAKTAQYREQEQRREAGPLAATSSDTVSGVSEGDDGSDALQANSSVRLSHIQQHEHHPSAAVFQTAAPPASAEESDDTEVDVIVLHVQEIGGKKYNALFNEYLGEAVRTLLPGAGWCSGLLMQPQNCDSTFTAMGVVLYLSKRVVPISSILSVRHRTYVAVADDPLTYTGHSGCLFLGGKFSNAEKSRKGYLLTSLRIGSTCINFVNLHLYHDADNSTAAAESPSKYTPRRVEAFLEAMSEVVPVVNPEDPIFIFGDFNTRLDAKTTLEFLEARLGCDCGAIKMGKKEVTAPDSFWQYFMSRDNHKDLQQFDREPRMLMDALATQSDMELCELPVHFPPTYMLDDSKHEAGAYHAHSAGNAHLVAVGKKKIRPYKRERLPAWCDRIFMNAAGLELITGLKGTNQNKIRKQNSGSRLKETVEREHEDAKCCYDSVSLECMDHEAVFLLF